MYRDKLYMLSFKHEGSMYLLLTPQNGSTPYLDPHEECALDIIEKMYTMCIYSPAGPAMIQKGEFELRMLNHEFDREDEGVYPESLVEWLTEVQNTDGLPDFMKGMVGSGAIARICNTPVGQLMGIPLKEELICLDYCADEKTEQLKNKVLKHNCN